MKFIYLIGAAIAGLAAAVPATTPNDPFTSMLALESPELLEPRSCNECSRAFDSCMRHCPFLIRNCDQVCRCKFKWNGYCRTRCGYRCPGSPSGEEVKPDFKEVVGDDEASAGDDKYDEEMPTFKDEEASADVNKDDAAPAPEERDESSAAPLDRRQGFPAPRILICRDCFGKHEKCMNDCPWWMPGGDCPRHCRCTLPKKCHDYCPELGPCP